MNKQKSMINTSDVATPESRQIDLDKELDGGGKEILLVNDDAGTEEYAWWLNFMNDDVTFIINQTTNKEDEKVITCALNGAVRYFERGVKYTVKRGFLIAIIRTQSTPTVTPHVDSDGLSQTKIVEVWSSKYPISIINDPSGKVGMSWFEHQCKQPF